jgi:hypothetical protein
VDVSLGEEQALLCGSRDVDHASLAALGADLATSLGDQDLVGVGGSGRMMRIDSCHVCGYCNQDTTDMAHSSPPLHYRATPEAPVDPPS